MTYDSIIIGAGFAGAVTARSLAEGGKRVLVIESRPHVGGNAYDCPDDAGIIIHKYGPHIFHTNDKEVFDFLSRFTAWRAYSHEVVGSVHGKYIPIPFNLNSLYLAFGAEKAARLEKKLVSEYGTGKKVSILDLKKSGDAEICGLADYVYENVFLHYTEKQWGTAPEDIDPAVTARVPVFVSRDNRYFQDEYQGMPRDGYTALFDSMLSHENITLRLGTEAAGVLSLDGGETRFEDEPFSGSVIYTGAADELFGCALGRLPYRTLDFEFQTLPMDWFQPKGTVNYTVDEKFTRITEFKHLTGQTVRGKTTILREYPRQYEGRKGEIPYYAVNNAENDALYAKYAAMAGEYKNLYLLGRLAEYRYYNMDAIAARALKLGKELLARA
jgi:UDP-galactopyranose mutase